MRLVLDTDVIVAAMRSPGGGSAAVVRAIRHGRGTLLLTTAPLFEYEAQCQSAEHRLAAGLDSRDVEQFLDSLVLLAEAVEAHFRWRPRLRDPGDEMVLEAAANGRAQALVTFNRRDYGKAPERFGIEVLSPGETLRRMKA